MMDILVLSRIDVVVQLVTIIKTLWSYKVTRAKDSRILLGIKRLVRSTRDRHTTTEVYVH